MDQKFIDKLQKIGLPDKEAKIYFFLIKSGGGYPSKIAQETKLNRSTVYKILTALSIKGIVTEIEKGKKIFYQAESIKKLERYTKFQLEKAQDATDIVVKLLPDLEAMFEKSGKPKVVFYEGREQVVEAYMSHIRVEKGYKMNAFVNVPDLRKFIPEKDFRFYVKEKERLGIRVRGITSTDPYSYEFAGEMFSGIKKSIWPVLKYIPKNKFNFPAEITMFDQDKISIIKFDETNPVGVIVVDKTIHDMFNAIFEIAWIGADHTNK